MTLEDLQKGNHSQMWDENHWNISDAKDITFFVGWGEGGGGGGGGGGFHMPACMHVFLYPMSI